MSTKGVSTVQLEVSVTVLERLFQHRELAVAELRCLNSDSQRGIRTALARSLCNSAHKEE
ncbi:hypothetical protein [Parahalioglobus pacificus]|uniref:Uncharacterized protein n=1 Tax=Parahalioglobus pacificus TaxID=930806 RepID=A0A919CLU8_9GAMM|nr:hypothetical protein [Halioglobus pacificus]GHD38079.1 hypothetical protein GCM10007053_28100 [Halioglobus pacificus]